METPAYNRPANAAYRFALALMCIAPSALALFAASVLEHRARFSFSGLWFIYEVSFFLGCVGAAIVTVTAIVEAVRRQIAAIFPWLMGISVAIGILLLWYARHIYRNPWAPTT